jgi:hypothetical protein
MRNMLEDVSKAPAYIQRMNSAEAFISARVHMTSLPRKEGKSHFEN